LGYISCRTEQKPYTIFGLALTLGLDRERLLKYDRHEAFASIIHEAVNKIRQSVEQKLLQGHAPAGAIFWLKNNGGWVDKMETSNVNKNEHKIDENSGLYLLFNSAARPTTGR